MKVRGFLSIILYMIGLTLSYTIGNRIIANPSNRKLYFVAGFTL